MVTITGKDGQVLVGNVIEERQQGRHGRRQSVIAKADVKTA